MYSLPNDDLDAVVNLLEKIWPSGKSFFITGGTGFFGRWMTEVISKIENKINSKNLYYISTRSDYSSLKVKQPILSQSFFKILELDLKKMSNLDLTFDYVIHAASDVAAFKSNLNTTVQAADDLILTTSNLTNHLNLNVGAKVLYISTGGVYQSKNSDYSELDLKVDVKNPSTYGQAKAISEDIILNRFENSTVARCFSFIGPYVSDKMAVMQMITKSLETKTIDVHSPAVVRSFLYPSDLISALFKLLLNPTQEKIYNVGSNVSISMIALAEKIKALNPVINVRIENGNDSTIALAGCYYLPNIQRFLKEFGPLETVGLDLALKKTYNFLESKK